jgi:hypothetical protein
MPLSPKELHDHAENLIVAVRDELWDLTIEFWRFATTGERAAGYARETRERLGHDLDDELRHFKELMISIE